MRWGLREKWHRGPLFMDDGQIKEEAGPQEFFEHPKDARLKEFLSKIL